MGHKDTAYFFEFKTQPNVLQQIRVTCSPCKPLNK